MVDCSVVIPIYNPEKGIEDIMFSQYDALIRALPGRTFQLVVVDDGSKENIQHILSKLRSVFDYVDYIQCPVNEGKGAALRKGVFMAKGKTILYTDYDFPYTMQSMKEVYCAIENKVGTLAIGVRSEAYYQKIPAMRKFVSRLLKSMNKSLMNLHTGDTQAGLKAFDEALKPLFLQTKINGFLFDLEFLKLAKSQQVSAELVQIKLREDVKMSKINPLSLIKELAVYCKLLFR